MKRKLKKTPFEKELKAEDTAANTKEEENTNKKTPRNLVNSCCWRELY
jgi:hypothetical protein